jgi:hypothetical protein
MLGALQDMHMTAPLMPLGLRLYMDQGEAEDPCRRGTCQGVFGDLIPKETPPASSSQKVQNGTYYRQTL